jgi:N-acetylglucosaminyldiphosphoundecaprenol N-acetyl-beta-D-mannosaminyltransferase
MTEELRRENILGVGINTINLQRAVETIAAWLDNGEHRYVCLTPAHSVMDAFRNREVRNVYNNSGMTTPDGMSIVWLLKLRGNSWVGRVYGPDLMLAVCKQGVRYGYKHFFYGGAPGVAVHLAKILEERYPGIKIVGTYSPPYGIPSPEQEIEIKKILNDSGADIVWVGMSSPKQDIWMADHIGRIKPSVLIGVGAAFDFLSHRKPQAPKLVQRFGLEWLFRFLSEPRRLWPRYRQYPRFVYLVFLQFLGIRSYPLT